MEIQCTSNAHPLQFTNPMDMRQRRGGRAAHGGELTTAAGGARRRTAAGGELTRIHTGGVRYTFLGILPWAMAQTNRKTI